MSRTVTILALAALLAAPALAQKRQPQGGYANPGAVIAAEIAFNQLAQEKGQWTAFLATAAPDAAMFVPQLVLASQHLKGKANPNPSVKWQPHLVWSSCDGSVAVTRGAWQLPASSGYFTTVWTRQRDGKYKWTLDQGEELPMPLDSRDTVVAKVADCPPGWRPKGGKPPKVKTPASIDPVSRKGQSLDGTLTWEANVAPDGSRRFVVAMRQGEGMATVQDIQAAAPPPSSPRG
jgi:hypothetical protein